MKKLIKRRCPNDPGDSGALNDLSFLLIIFFIVIAGFNINKGFLIDLPDNQKPRVVNTNDLLKCFVGSDGNLFIDGKSIDREALFLELRGKKSQYPNMTFLLVIHPETPWQHVVAIIHDTRRLDIENFSFRMEDPSR